MQTVTAAVSWKGLSLRFVTSAPRTNRGKQLDLTARCSGKSHRNARAQPGLMQVPPRRWKTLRLRLDFKLQTVGLLKFRSASLSLLPGTPSDFDAHVMWRRQHTLHLGFTVCPTYRPFNTVGEKTGGKSDKLHGIYVAGNYTDTAKAKPWHTHTHLPFVFRVHHNGCDCRNRMQMSTGVSRNVFSRRRAVGVCAVGWQSFILRSLTWLMEPERCIFLFRSASLHSSITTFCHRS